MPDVQINAAFRFSTTSSHNSPLNTAAAQAPPSPEDPFANFRLNIPGFYAGGGLSDGSEGQSSSFSTISQSRSAETLGSRRPSSLQCPSGVTVMLALRTELWVGCEDGSIRRFSILLRNEKTAIQAHAGPVSCLLLLANGTVVSASSTDNDICLWSQKGESVSKVASKPLFCLVDAGEFLWCGTTGKKIMVRNKDKLLKPKRELLLPEGGGARCMLQVGENIWVASMNSILLYDVLKLKLTRAIENVHSDIICSLVVGRRCVFSASHDHTIKVWSFDASEGKRLQQHTDKVLCLCNSPSRDLFFSGSSDKTVVSWSAHTHEQAAVDSNSHQAPVSSITVVSVPEERRTELWTASLDGGIHIKPID